MRMLDASCRPASSQLAAARLHSCQRRALQNTAYCSAWVTTCPPTAWLRTYAVRALQARDDLGERITGILGTRLALHAAGRGRLRRGACNMLCQNAGRRIQKSPVALAIWCGRLSSSFGARACASLALRPLWHRPAPTSLASASPPPGPGPPPPSPSGGASPPGPACCLCSFTPRSFRICGGTGYTEGRWLRACVDSGHVVVWHRVVWSSHHIAPWARLVHTAAYTGPSAGRSPALGWPHPPFSS